MEIDKVVDWLDLEKDMLELILTRLKVVVDFIHFGAVCKRWHSVFLENRDRLSHQFPVLMLPSQNEYEEKNEFRTFFSLSDKQTYRLKKLPNEEDKWCFGSSEGYLIMIDLNLNISFLNPFSRTETPLPCLTTLFVIIDSHMSQTGTIEYTYQLPGQNLPMVQSAEYMREMCIYKAITAGPYVIAIDGLRFNLAFCRRDGDTWTYLESKWSPYHDVVCYNGKFYAVSESSHVVVLDVSGPHPTVTMVVMNVGRDVEFDNMSLENYLVESSGQLLVLKRFDEMRLENIWKTASFEIFRVDVDKRLFFHLKALGDCILFIGENRSMSLSTQDFFGYEGNRIYFTDRFKEPYSEEMCGGYELLVYDVEDGSIEPYYKTDSRWWWLWPIWLTPQPW